MFESCRDFKDNREYIVCEERRTKITFHNSTGETVEKIRVDGCVIADGDVKKCDYLLCCTRMKKGCTKRKKALFIELKGNKVMTAIEQLAATLENKAIKEPLGEYEKRLYAVVAGNPLPLSKMQNIQAGFNKRHKCTLRVVGSSHTYDLLSGKQID